VASLWRFVECRWSAIIGFGRELLGDSSSSLQRHIRRLRHVPGMQRASRDRCSQSCKSWGASFLVFLHVEPQEEIV